MLGEDIVLLDRPASDERLGETFAVTLHMISEHGQMDFLPCLGSGISITMQAGPRSPGRSTASCRRPSRSREPQGLVYRLGLGPGPRSWH